MNQCDGCRRGLPLVDGWMHVGPTPWDAIGCTRDRYDRTVDEVIAELNRRWYEQAKIPEPKPVEPRQEAA